MNFLVIDDDKTFRDATCLMIEDEGHQAQPAAAGTVALETLKTDPCDAVLLDVNLGVENGLDVLQLILKQHPALPVVMFTAQGTVKTAVEAMRRGALDYLEKPFTFEQLHTTIARLKRFQQLSRNIERLEQEVKDIKSQTPELLLDFSTPADAGRDGSAPARRQRPRLPSSSWARAAPGRVSSPAPSNSGATWRTNPSSR